MEQTNIVSVITQAINNLFSNLFSSIDNNLYSVLDDLVFINTNILDNNYLQNFFGDRSSGLILICNALLIGFILYYSISLIFSYLTFSQVQRPLQFIFKLLFCIIAINFSNFLCDKIIWLVSWLSLCIRELGESLLNFPICFSNLIQKLNSTISIGNTAFSLFSLEGFIKSFISIGFLNLGLSYALRYIMIKVFALLSPFAFLSLILPNSSWFFKSWIKIFLSLLFLQILVPIILIITFSLDYSDSNIFSKLVYLGSIYALIKANSYVTSFMGGISTEVGLQLSNLKSLFLGGNT